MQQQSLTQASCCLCLRYLCYTVEKTALMKLERTLSALLLAYPEIDAVALELHGSLLKEGTEDPEAILCAEVRDD